MKRILAVVTDAALAGNGWKKLLNPSVLRGKTAWPKESGDQERFGVRYDYDGEKEQDGIVYHKYQMQANKGDKIPSSIKNWRAKAQGGTHAVMADVLIPKGGEKEDVRAALEKAHKTVMGY